MQYPEAANERYTGLTDTGIHYMLQLHSSAYYIFCTSTWQNAEDSCNWPRTSACQEITGCFYNNYYLLTDGKKNYGLD
jgi:hypothetical protein